MRTGFTLVETLVALILLQFAMLALAATSAVAARDFATAHRSVRAQALARNQMELIRANACRRSAAEETVHQGGFTLRWRIESRASRRDLSVEVTFEQPGRRVGRVALRSAALCA